MTFEPQVEFITSITRGQNTVVGFDVPHDFTPGEIVSFRVSKASGTFEMNNLQATISSITTNSITVPIDSTNFTSFINAGQYIPVPAVCVPSASGILPNFSPVTVSLLDVFDNVPPG